MRSVTALILGVLLLASALCAIRGQSGGEKLFADFIAALNSPDPAKLQQFVKSNFAPNLPTDERLKRLQPLVSQGAPFKVTKVDSASDSECSALVEDTHGTSLNFVLSLDANHKILRLMIRPTEDAGGPPPKDYTGWTSLSGLVASIQRDTDSPGMAVAEIHDGKLENAVSGTRHTGKNDLAKSDDTWSIGSIGKPLCSTVVAKLIEEGKLNWDTTLAEALPGVPMNPGYREVTLEQIMHHRGGIPQDLGFRHEQVEKIVKDAKTPGDIRWNYAQDILSREPVAKPGTRFAYSNAGYELLGVVAERTTGKSYETLVKQLIFKPLGLRHSFTGIDTLPTARPSGHVKGPKGWEEANFTGPMEFMFAPAGGGMFMSVADLARFGQAHLAGLQGKDGLLKAATVERLHRALPADGLDYACGWGVESFPGMETFQGHNGSNGTFRAQLCIFPKAGVVVAAFVNCGGESDPSPPLQAAQAIGRKIAKAG